MGRFWPIVGVLTIVGRWNPDRSLIGTATTSAPTYTLSSTATPGQAGPFSGSPALPSCKFPLCYHPARPTPPARSLTPRPPPAQSPPSRPPTTQPSTSPLQPTAPKLSNG